jgi:hypothetical protein
MELPQPVTGPSQPPQPAWAWPVQPPAAAPPAAAPGRVQRVHKPRLVMRARADRRLVTGAVAGGVFLDIAVRAGLATIAGSAWVGIAAAAILLGGRIRGLASRLFISAAPVPGLILTLSSSPWVIAPAAFAVTLLLILGVSLGADGSGLSATFPALGARIAIATGHLAFAPGLLRSPGQPAAGGVAARRAVAVARGALLAAPVMIIVGLLLALADPIFRSWFDLTAILQHLVLASIGAWAVLGLSRAASAERPSPRSPSAPALGTVEAALVLGGLCALYATFVGAQFVALSGGGQHVIVTQGLTYAQYARSGFFQLLGCAAITLLVLLGVRACASAAHPVLTGLSWLTIALTIGVVIVAIRRLQLYEAEFGLTMLRLACLVAAVWIGIVFVLLGSTVPRRGLPRSRFPAAVILSGLIFAGIWSISNPASIVAQTNLRRAEHGQRFDVHQAASLGPDAVPALVAGLGHLDAALAIELRHAICARSPGKDAGTAFNMSRARASKALARACG